MSYAHQFPLCWGAAVGGDPVSSAIQRCQDCFSTFIISGFSIVYPCLVIAPGTSFLSFCVPEITTLYLGGFLYALSFYKSCTNMLSRCVSCFQEDRPSIFQILCDFPYIEDHCHWQLLMRRGTWQSHFSMSLWCLYIRVERWQVLLATRSWMLNLQRIKHTHLIKYCDNT